jgi:hypothetical protein
MKKQLHISAPFLASFKAENSPFSYICNGYQTFTYVDTLVTLGYTRMYPLGALIIIQLYVRIHRIHFSLDIIILLLLLYTVSLYTIYYFPRKKCFRVSAYICKCVSLTYTDTRRCIRVYPCIPLLLICFSL